MPEAAPAPGCLPGGLCLFQTKSYTFFECECLEIDRSGPCLSPTGWVFMLLKDRRASLTH